MSGSVAAGYRSASCVLFEVLSFFFLLWVCVIRLGGEKKTYWQNHWSGFWFPWSKNWKLTSIDVLVLDWTCDTAPITRSLWYWRKSKKKRWWSCTSGLQPWERLFVLWFLRGFEDINAQWTSGLASIRGKCKSHWIYKCVHHICVLWFDWVMTQRRKSAKRTATIRREGFESTLIILK